MEGGRRIIKVGEGDDLRKVEKDVLVPKIMKEKSMDRCREFVKGINIMLMIIAVKKGLK